MENGELKMIKTRSFFTYTVIANEMKQSSHLVLCSGDYLRSKTFFSLLCLDTKKQRSRLCVLHSPSLARKAKKSVTRFAQTADFSLRLSLRLCRLTTQGRKRSASDLKYEMINDQSK